MHVLIITPHPDDIEAVIGGLVARLVDEGNKVECIYLTSGEMGSKNPRLRGPQLAARRKREAIEAAKITGMRVIGFLGFPDAGVKVTTNNLDKIKKIITEKSPDVILTPEPYYSWYTHRDHLNTGRLVHLAWQETGKKQKIYFYHTRAPNIWIDVSRWVFRGIRALIKHRSQQPDVIMFIPMLLLLFALPRPGRLTVGLRDPTKKAKLIFPVFVKVPEEVYERRKRSKTNN